MPSPPFAVHSVGTAAFSSSRFMYSFDPYSMPGQPNLPRYGSRSAISSNRRTAFWSRARRDWASKSSPNRSERLGSPPLPSCSPMLNRGTPSRAATVRQNSVLPVPGGPWRRMLTPVSPARNAPRRRFPT